MNVSVVLLLGLAALLSRLAWWLRRHGRKGPVYWTAVVALAAVVAILVATAIGLVLDSWLSESRPWKLMAERAR